MMKNLIFMAGLLHWCQLPAMFIAPHMLGWKEDLAQLSIINRRIVKVIGLSIMYVVLGMGIVVMLSAEALTDGSNLSIGVTAFLAVLWLFRGTVQWTLYSKVWPRGALGRLSHYGLGLLFIGLSLVYFFALAANFRVESAE